jgi:serine/threonine protein kinase
VEQESKIGEGRTARVFSLAESRIPLPVCVKIWKPDVLSLKNKNIINYRKLQYGSPEEEFDLQDDLYMKGFQRIPRPIAFEKIGEYQAMAMEELPGYTLKEIEDAGAIIENPSWQELERLIFDLNINQRIAHRDLSNKQNIFIKTNDQLSSGGKIKGEVYIIDFGLSKKTPGTPEPEDFTLTIGRDMIRYPNDRTSVESLKPRPGRSNLFAH